MFSVRVSDSHQGMMLNICDSELLGKKITDGTLVMHIRPTYYGQRVVDATEAGSLLSKSAIINMAGEKTVSLAVELGVGSHRGVRHVSGVPFLIVFRM